MVANYAGGKRRFDCYHTEDEALEAARLLARRLAERKVLAAELTNEDAAAYAAAVQQLAPFGVSLPVAADTMADCLRRVGSLANLREAAREWAGRHVAPLPRRTVAQVAEECLAAKARGGARKRYLDDLRMRFRHVTAAFRCQIASVRGEDVQQWLDGLGLSPQSLVNYRRVLRLLFRFAQRRGYLPKAWDELDRLEVPRAKGGEVELFTPEEMARLLAEAEPDFRPVLALGAFAGLRSAEIERLDWSDLDFEAGHIVVARDKAKTASRRIVPLLPNLRAWLELCPQRHGPVWNGLHDLLYLRQQQTARQAGLRWRRNGLRHSFVSYRLALVKDAAQVALEAGNSPAMVFGHYRELVTEAQARAWFALRPQPNP